MANVGDDVERAIDLSGDEYVVVQPAIGSDHRVEDAEGNVVLRGTQERLKMNEETTFVDDVGRSILTVRAGAVLDLAGDYTLVDETTAEPLVLLDPRFSMLTERWVLRDPDTEAVIAEIENWSKTASFLRHLPVLGAAFRIVPHGAEITDADGLHVGTIDRQFSIEKRYVVRIDDDRSIPRDAVVAATMVIHALAGT
jgi:uncharacterized protein YxjI